MTSLTVTQETQPDILYHPDKQKYLLRAEQIRTELPANTELPSQFPQQLTGPLVWTGEEFTDEREWTFVLSELHLREIHDALLHFKGLLRISKLF